MTLVFGEYPLRFDFSKRVTTHSSYTFDILPTMAPTDALSEAAAALVKAAQLDVAGTAQNQQLAANLESLKKSFDSSVHGIQQAIQNSEKNFNDKINTLNQKIDTLNGNVNEVKSEIATLRKMQGLEWAMQNIEVGSFLYYPPEYKIKKQSSTIVLPVLCFSAWYRGLH
jgi:TolA-binding protein